MTDNQAQRTPYDAKHVQIVDMGRTVWALYIPDPEQAKDPRKVADNICAPEYRNVELVARAERFYKKEGADFSGWVVSDDGNFSHTDGIPNKRQAMAALRGFIAQNFERTPAVEAAPAPEPEASERVPGTLVDPWTWIRRPAMKPDLSALANPKKAEPETIAEIHAERCPDCKGAGCPICGYKGRPRPCIHGTHPRNDVVGDPVATCAAMTGGTTYGAFNDEGCFYSYDCAVDVANEAAREAAEIGGPVEETGVTWGTLCQDHEEQLADGCEECAAELADDSDDED
jgi:hypothetical protein